VTGDRPPVITTEGLTKRFGRITAVDSVGLDVREGDVYGFLGANGSGKTTTVRMLLGLVLATSGSIEVLGRPMPRAGREVLPEVGALVEGPAAYPRLSGRANLALFDAMGPAGPRRTRAGRVDDALDQVGLGGVDKRPVRAYSLGMRQRLGLALALLRRPRLLVLDEPTNGLDPQGIHEVRDLLLALNADGTTVFLSSHLLSEVGHLCSRVGVLDGGRMVLQEELSDLLRPTGRVVLTTPQPDAARALLDGRVEAGSGTRVVVRDTDPASLNELLVASGVPVTSLAEERRTLEEVVLEASRPGSDRWSRP
jgi:ABC-2 type transport system ATP-binding protein